MPDFRQDLIFSGEPINSKLLMHCERLPRTALDCELAARYSTLLNEDECNEILHQFQCLPLHPGRQVFWSGVAREWVQEWADQRGLQTLTTAMGPLMDRKSAACRRNIRLQRNGRGTSKVHPHFSQSLYPEAMESLSS